MTSGRPPVRLAAAAGLALALVLVLGAVPTLGVAAQTDAPTSDPTAGAGPEVTVLLHHPSDGVDPFGFDYAGGTDYVSLRYSALVADQRFDYPFFVADGVLPLEGPIDTAKPFVAARDAYEATVAQRAAEQAPAALHLASTLASGSAVVAVQVRPVAALAGEDLHLMLALTEDPVHYLPPDGLTNGIEDHRFTVRAIADLGPLDLAAGTPLDLGHTFSLDDAWLRDRLVVAAWLQQDAASPRFDAREVVQATHAPLGKNVEQDAKGVLLEMLSATWCDPCLYGDLAIEAVAVAHGAAEPLEPAATGARYFEPAGRPWLAIAAALVAGVVVAWWGGGRK